ncbi:aminotransferase class IV [Lujinxingia litoralis]|nr:aminotransferase class IV [Lujinxingia litoralis]
MREDDRSFLYGDGLFETVRVEGGKVRRLEAHRERLRRSAAELGFGVRGIDEACDLLGRPPGQDGLWRVTVSRQDTSIAFGGSGQVCGRWRPGHLARPAPQLKTFQGFYLPDDRLAEHKTTSWIRSVELRRRACQAGADDGVGISRCGLVGEASAANIFVQLDQGWVTPEVRGILPGVTRGALLRHARQVGFELDEAKVTVEDLRRARAIALTSAGIGVLGAASVDGRGLELERVANLKALLEGCL